MKRNEIVNSNLNRVLAAELNLLTEAVLQAKADTDIFPTEYIEVMPT